MVEPKVTDLFRQIHRLRKHLHEVQSEIDLGPRVLKAKQTWLAEEQQLNKDAHETLKKLKLKQKEDEVTLKQLDALLNKLAGRQLEVTTMKEIEAVRTEITTNTHKKSELEDAILATIMEIEERTNRLPEDDKRWADAQTEFKQFEIDGQERFARLKREVAEATKELASLDVKLPANVKGIYDRLVKTYGPNSLASVVGRSCQQCRANITEQQVHNIRGGQFMCCPTCGRCLYFAE